MEECDPEPECQSPHVLLRHRPRSRFLHSDQNTLEHKHGVSGTFWHVKQQHPCITQKTHHHIPVSEGQTELSNTVNALAKPQKAAEINTSVCFL